MQPVLKEQRSPSGCMEEGFREFAYRKVLKRTQTIKLAGQYITLITMLPPSLPCFLSITECLMVVLRKMLGLKLASSRLSEILLKDFQREGPTAVKAFELWRRVHSVISILKRYIWHEVTPVHRKPTSLFRLEVVIDGTIARWKSYPLVEFHVIFFSRVYCCAPFQWAD